MKKIKILNFNEKKIYFFIVFCTLLAMILEVVGIGLIVPLMTLLTDQENFVQNQAFINFFNYFNLEIKNLKIGDFIFFLISIFTFKFFFITTLYWYKNKFAYLIQTRVSRKIFSIFLNKNLLYLNNVNSSRLIQDIRDEPSLYANNIIIGSIDLLAEIILVLGISILLLFFSFWSTSLIFFLTLTIIFAYRFFFKKKTMKWAQSKKHFDKINLNLLRYVFGSVIQIKMGDKEKSVDNKFTNNLKKMAYFMRRQLFMLESPRVFLEFFTAIIFLIFILFSTKFNNSFNDLIPILGLYAISAFKILPSVNRILTAIQKINFGKNSLNIIIDIFKNKELYSETYYDKSEFLIKSFKSKIEIKNLNFEYNNSKKIFSNLNLVINKGDFIGIKGESGSGKTTLVNIILGFFRPKIDNGTITVDDIDIHNDLKGWQKLVGYASQNIYILDDTLLNNVCFEENPNHINFESFNRAIEMADLREFVNNLINKENTVLGERGSKISGGQMQRIGLARSIYHFPQILVLDEITSALDPTTESRILESIKKLSKYMTIILISHRLKTLEICKKIISIDDLNLKKNN